MSTSLGPNAVSLLNADQAASYSVAPSKRCQKDLRSEDSELRHVCINSCPLLVWLSTVLFRRRPAIPGRCSGMRPHRSWKTVLQGLVPWHPIPSPMCLSLRFYETPRPVAPSKYFFYSGNAEPVCVDVCNIFWLVHSSGSVRASNAHRTGSR